MSDSSAPGGLKGRKVLARDGVHAKVLGLTLEEAVAMGGATFFALVVIEGSMPTLFLCNGIAWLWIRKVKRMLPDNYLSDMGKFFLRKHFHFRASEPDTTIGPYLTGPRADAHRAGGRRGAARRRPRRTAPSS